MIKLPAQIKALQIWETLFIYHSRQQKHFPGLHEKKNPENLHNLLSLL